MWNRTEKIIVRAEYGDVHLSLSPKLGTMPNRAFRECALREVFLYSITSRLPVRQLLLC